MPFIYQSVSQRLVGAWCPSLGATGYSLLDRSGYGRHGTLTNMAGQLNWVASGSGVALNMDATNDQVVLPTAPMIVSGQPFSVSWWENQTSANIYSGRVRFAYSSSASWTALRVVGDANYANLCCGPQNGGNSVKFAASSTTVGVWKHFCIVASAGPQSNSSSDYAAFENGVSVSASNGGTFASNSSQVNFIGSSGLNHQPAAMLDDVRVYSRALSLSEVRLLASARGIGLMPLRSTAVISRKAWINVGGTWKNADSYVNVGGTWKLSVPSINVGGTWK